VWYTPEQLEERVKSAATFKVAELVLILLAGEAGLRSGEAPSSCSRSCPN